MALFNCVVSVLLVVAWDNYVLTEDILNHPAWKYLPSNDCGIGRPAGRIIKGKQTVLGQFPWMARLGYMKKGTLKFQCGGALVNPLYIVTAAHCIRGNEDTLKVIRLGENDGGKDEDCDGAICAPPVQDVEPENIILHSQYKQAGSKNDIAIIKLKTPIKYNMFVKPICLPRENHLTMSYLNRTTTVAGWGVIDSSSEATSNKLLYIHIPVRDRDVCNKVYKPMTLDESQLCVGVTTGEDSCTGDSGGPLMYWEPDTGHKKHYLLGVVSFGRSYCGESESVYSNVVFYMEWILDNIKSGAADSVRRRNLLQSSMKNRNVGRGVARRFTEDPFNQIRRRGLGRHRNRG